MNDHSRRDFLRLAGLASASLMLPNFLRGNGNESSTLVDQLLLPKTNGKRLVVIQFSGGNDGLNTIIPFGDDLYHSNRPGIGIKADGIIRIDDFFAFNNSLQGLADLHADGQVALLNNVGYPNPNRSHFRSLDIWHSASDANKYLQTGWVGRWLDAACGNDVRPHLALEVDETLSLAMKGFAVTGLAMRNPARLELLTKNPFLQATASSWQAHEEDHHNVEYLHKTLAETSKSVDYLHDHLQKNKAKALYPQHAFGKKMKLIADLILSDCETAIYYVSLPGFDTHAGQNNQQNRLLKVYGDAVKAFAQDLKEAGQWDSTLLMTFSEFGRRVKQNASKGTDHGTANVMMFAGGSLRKKGVLNEAPDLKNLDNGDLIYKVDFRSVYATILQSWLATDPEIVLGQKFGLMDFI